MKSTTRARTKMLRTERSLPVILGKRRYAVPAELFSQLEKDLETHLLREDFLTAEQFFGTIGDNLLPDWAVYLRGLRYRENLTQVQFASKIGIPQSNLSAMENGRRPIGKELAKKIGVVFNTDYRYFL